MYLLKQAPRILILLLSLQIMGCSNHALSERYQATVVKTDKIQTTIAFTSDLKDKFEIYIVDGDGNGLKNLTGNLAFSSHPSWSPDGKKIAFSAYQQGPSQIYIMNADGSEQKQVTYGEMDKYAPEWSPNGKYLLFLSMEYNSDIRNAPIQQGYIMNPDGSDLRKITSSAEFISAMSWYPSESLVSVSVGEDRYTQRTYVMDVNGVYQKTIPEFSTPIGNPKWSPDGKSVAYSSTLSGCNGITIIRPGSTSQTCLLIDVVKPASTIIGSINWTSDGKQLLFSADIDGDYDIYSINVDGSELRQKINLPGDDSEAVIFDRK